MKLLVILILNLVLGVSSVYGQLCEDWILEITPKLKKEGILKVYKRAEDKTALYQRTRGKLKKGEFKDSELFSVLREHMPDIAESAYVNDILTGVLSWNPERRRVALLSLSQEEKINFLIWESAIHDIVKDDEVVLVCVGRMRLQEAVDFILYVLKDEEGDCCFWKTLPVR